ncbi:hypothetical protein F7734_48305 [Scytonema sp. UIC 10036]|uniref:hypothetical protein n=1 Tax=Scytonema sp. UIC 10036 TaxID=2304196 RepID=UPI0012DA0D2F|nr:hypothetical protein [Scytonema sp. UIC 10036]MUG99673.1 hypothetical protein [Scytonema sp. UIC 10036]
MTVLGYGFFLPRNRALGVGWVEERNPTAIASASKTQQCQENVGFLFLFLQSESRDVEYALGKR